LNPLQAASLKQYGNHWANMIVMIARTVNRSSNEPNAVEFWFYNRQRILNDNQKTKLLKLLVEAKKDNPEKIVMELLLFDLNMSIVCSQNPVHSDSVNNISMKTASETYSKLYFIDHDGSYRFLRDLTKVHAVMIFCFRAIILYAIFLKEGLFNLNEGNAHDIIVCFILIYIRI
jgi:hypothetical protein